MVKQTRSRSFGLINGSLLFGAAVASRACTLDSRDLEPVATGGVVSGGNVSGGNVSGGSVGSHVGGRVTESGTGTGGMPASTGGVRPVSSAQGGMMPTRGGASSGGATTAIITGGVSPITGGAGGAAAAAGEAGTPGHPPVETAGGGGAGGVRGQGGEAGNGSGGAPEGGIGGSSEAGSGGVEGNTQPLCTLGDLLVPDMGWVDARTNCAGIQGRLWFAWTRDSNSFGSIVADTGVWCLQGSQGDGGLVPSPWDLATGLYLNQLTDQSTPSAYDAAAHQVSGVRFRVSGAVPSYFGAVIGQTLYCAPIQNAGDLEFRWSELQENCWDPTAAAHGPPDPSLLESIGFFATNEWGPVAFDYCISQLKALPP